MCCMEKGERGDKWMSQNTRARVFFFGWDNGTDKLGSFFKISDKKFEKKKTPLLVD